MGVLAVDLFITLDGVYQAPGGPDEDRSGGFQHGGWQAPYFDDESGAMIGAGIDRLDALLLGRTTYDIFAGYWPNQGDDPIAVKFNAVPKFVASRTLTDPSWAGTTVVSDIAAEVPDAQTGVEEEDRWMEARAAQIHNVTYPLFGIIGMIALVGLWLLQPVRRG